MALNDDAVLTAAIGYVYTAPVGTVAPSPAALKALNLNTPSGWTPNTWNLIGHTSRNDMPEFGFDGGDSEVKGTWQKKKLKEVTTEDPVDYLTIYLQQFDETALEMYYGVNATATEGLFGVSASGADPTEKAFLIVIEDGDFRLGFHAHKASVRRDDAIQLPVDDLASLPVKATFLQHNSEPLLFSWINEDLFNAVPGVPVLSLGGATGGTYTLRVNGVESGSIAYNANAAAIKSALVAVDDGISAAQVTVTADGADFDIEIPADLSLGTDSTTGGSGVTVS